MAIGNQLDLQIVVNGFNQAQNALSTLGGSFSELRNSVIAYQTAQTRLSDVIKAGQLGSTNFARQQDDLTESLDASSEALARFSGEGNEVQEQARDVADATQMLSQITGELTTNVINTTAVLGGLVAELGINLISSIREASIEMEQLTIQLKTIGNVGEDTTASLQRLVEMAKLPGIDFQSAVKGVTQLRATGISAGLAEEAVMQLGNALASVGGDPNELSGVVRAFSQIQSKGKVYAEEIYQIAERLPQIRKIMLDVIGTADTELLAKEGYSANQFLMMVTDGLGRLPRVADNTRNQLSNLKNEVFLLSASLGKQLIPFSLKLIRTLNGIISWIGSLNVETKKSIVSFVGWAVAIGALIKTGSILFTIISTAIKIFNGVAGASTLAMTASQGQAVAQQLVAVTGMQQSVALGIVQKANIGLAKSAGTATVATIALKIAIGALTAITVVGLIATVVAGVYAWMKFSKETKKAKTATDDLNNSVRETKELLGEASEVVRFTENLLQQSNAMKIFTENLDEAREAIIKWKNEQREKGMSEEFINENVPDTLQLADKRQELVIEYAEKKMTTQVTQVAGLLAKSGLKVASFVHDFEDVGKRLYIEMDDGSKEMVDTEKEYKQWRDKYRDAIREEVNEDRKVQLERIKTAEQRVKVIESKKDRFKFTWEAKDEGIDTFKKLQNKDVFATQFDTMNSMLRQAFSRGIEDVVDLNTRVAQSEMLGKYIKEVQSKKDATVRMVAGKGGNEWSELFSDFEGGKANWILVKNLGEELNDYNQTTRRVVTGVNSDQKTSASHISLQVNNYKTLNELYNRLSAELDANKDKERSPVAQKSFERLRELQSQMKTKLDTISTPLDETNKSLLDATQAMENYPEILRMIFSENIPRMVTQRIEQATTDLEAKQNEIRKKYDSIKLKIQNVGNNKAGQFALAITLSMQDELSGFTDLDDQLKRVDMLREKELLGLEMQFNRLDSLQETTTKGLGEAVKVLMDASLTESEQLRIVNEYIERNFLDPDTGQFSVERIKARSLFIEAVVAEEGEFIDKFKRDSGEEYRIKRYAGFTKVEESLNALYKALESYGEGSAVLETLVAQMALERDQLVEFETKQINQINNQTQQLLEQMRSFIDLQQDSVAKSISLEMISHAETMRGLKQQIEMYKAESYDDNTKIVKDLEKLMEIEEDLHVQRIGNIREEAKISKEAKKQSIDKLQLEVSNLKEQRDMSFVADPESYEMKKRELELTANLADIEAKRTQLNSEYRISQKIITSAKGEQKDLIEQAKQSEDDLLTLLQARSVALNTLGKEHEAYATTLADLTALNALNAVQGFDAEEKLLDLMIEKLKIQNQLNIKKFEEKKHLEDGLKALTHAQKLAMANQKLALLQLKLNNKNGKNNIDIILQENEISKLANKQKQEAIQEEIRLKKELQAENIRELNFQLLVEKGKKAGIQGALEVKEGDSGLLLNLKESNDEINRLQNLINSTNDPTAFQDLNNQLTILKELAKAFGIELDIAFKNEALKQANELMQATIKDSSRQLSSTKRITQELVDQANFYKEMGMSAGSFGFKNFGDQSKFDQMKEQFKSFFTTQTDPQIIADLKTFNAELESIKADRKAIEDNEEMDRKDQISKLKDLNDKEMDLHLKFNQDYRNAINELKDLHDQRYDDGREYLNELDQIAKEEEKMDIDAKYSGRKISNKEKSQQLKENIEHNIKWIQKGHEAEEEALKQEKSGLNEGTDAYIENERKMDILKKKTALSLRKEHAKAFEHNIRITDQQGKNQNKLGGAVLKWRDGELKRQSKFHKDVESLENKHQHEMNNFVNQEGLTREEKAKRHTQMQIKLIQDRKRLNEAFAKEQSSSKDDLFKTLKGSHTSKVGEKFELDPNVKAMIDALTNTDNTELKELPKTVDKIMEGWHSEVKTVQEYKKGFNIFGWNIGGQDADVEGGKLQFKKMLEDDTEGLIVALRKIMGTSEFIERYGSGGYSDDSNRTEEQLNDLATTIAKYVAYGVTPEMLREMFKSGSSVTDLTDAEKILKEKQKVEEQRLAEEQKKRQEQKIKAENEQIKKINEFNNALSGLSSGEESKLAQFSSAVTLATSKLAQFSNALNNPPPPPPSGNGQPPIFNFSGTLDIDKTGLVLFNSASLNGQRGISPSFGFSPFGSENKNYRYDAKTLGNQLGTSRSRDMFVGGDEITNVLNENRTTIIHNTYNNSSSSGDPG